MNIFFIVFSLKVKMSLCVCDFAIGQNPELRGLETSGQSQERIGKIAKLRFFFPEGFHNLCWL